MQHINAKGTGDMVNGALGVCAYLHKGSSRSYPGRPVQQAADVLGSVLHSNMQGVWAGISKAIVGEGSHPKGTWGTGNEPGEEKSLEDSPR